MNFENAVVENGVGITVHDNVTIWVVWRWENVPILPEQRWIGCSRTGQERQCCFTNLGCTFAYDVACDNFVWFGTLVENLTFGNRNFEVDRLNRVGYAERSQCENTTAVGCEVDWDVDKSGTGIWDTIIESFDDGICWSVGINRFWTNERAIFFPAHRWRQWRVEIRRDWIWCVNLKPGVVWSIAVEGDLDVMQNRCVR